MPPPCHRWDVSPKQAIAIQSRLATLVIQRKPATTLRFVAGVDCAFSSDGTSCLCVAILWDRQTRSVVDEVFASRKLRFPYVPGLLSFRESPTVLAALSKLDRSPDVIMCDGHGLAHPRLFGIACHVGVLTDTPALGCGKSRLVGSHREPGLDRGNSAALRYRGQVVGTVLRTRSRVKPIYVSVGHKMDLGSARRLALSCGNGFRLPEPTRLADQAVAREKKARGFAG